MSLSIDTQMQETGQLIIVTGEVDVSNAGELRTTIDKALVGAPAVLEVDLGEVPYIDSTGIGVLVGAATRAREAGTTFKVIHVQKNVERVLALLGVEKDLGLVQE